MPLVAEVFAAGDLSESALGLLADAWAEPSRRCSPATRRCSSELLDGMHAVDGLLDVEGAAYVNQAIRFLARPAEHDSRTAAQRRADALVAMGASLSNTTTSRPGGDYGRQTRTIRDALYELLVVRDGGCRWPGCENLSNSKDAPSRRGLAPD